MVGYRLFNIQFNDMKRFALLLILCVPMLLCADDVYYWNSKPKKQKTETSVPTSQQVASPQAVQTNRPNGTTTRQNPTNYQSAQRQNPTNFQYVSPRQDTVVMVIQR